MNKLLFNLLILTLNLTLLLSPCWGVSKVILGNVAAPTSVNLTVDFKGSGTGTVSFSPSIGGDCTSDCTREVNRGTTVTLTASVTDPNVFNGWSQEGCSGTGTCVILMDHNASVEAEFWTPAARCSNELVGWYRVDEGIGATTVINHANPANPADKLPDLTVLNTTGTFWTTNPGFGTGNGTCFQTVLVGPYAPGITNWDEYSWSVFIFNGNNGSGANPFIQFASSVAGNNAVASMDWTQTVAPYDMAFQCGGSTLFADSGTSTITSKLFLAGRKTPGAGTNRLQGFVKRSGVVKELTADDGGCGDLTLTTVKEVRMFYGWRNSFGDFRCWVGVIGDWMVWKGCSVTDDEFLDVYNRLKSRWGML